MNNLQQLTIFYDGQCPLCATEMQHLKMHDTNNKIVLVDLHSDEFAQQYTDINFERAMNILHGRYQGQLLLGLSVTHRAWTLVGKGFWVTPLNWPIVKQISHLVYLVVAKYRHPISHFFAKRFGLSINQCDTGVCQKKK